MSRKKRNNDACGTDAGATRESSTEIRQVAEVLAGGVVNRNSDHRLGPPSVGQPWPDGIEVEFAFSSERDTMGTHRSFGLKGRASRRMILGLVLISIVIGAATAHNNEMIPKFFKSVINMMK